MRARVRCDLEPAPKWVTCTEGIRPELVYKCAVWRRLGERASERTRSSEGRVIQVELRGSTYHFRQ